MTMSRSPRKQQPEYARVKAFVMSKVTRGELVIGARVPSENELVKALGVSRMTVNRALRELSDQGLVLRQQGVGTFIATPPPRSSLIEIRNIAEEITARGHAHTMTLVTLESLAADAGLVASLGLKPKAKVFRSVVVHYEDAIAIQLEERFVNPAFAPHYGRQDFTRQTTSAYLHTIASVTEVEHELFAVTADAPTRKLLKIGARESCLQMIRKTWVNEVPTSKGILTYPGSRYSLASRYQVAR